MEIKKVYWSFLDDGIFVTMEEIKENYFANDWNWKKMNFAEYLEECSYQWGGDYLYTLEEALNDVNEEKESIIANWRKEIASMDDAEEAISIWFSDYDFAYRKFKSWGKKISEKLAEMGE